MNKDYLTTFKAAKVLSVTPDSILKWIKSGILEARRTPGGHHRIARKSVEALLEVEQNKDWSSADEEQFQYCWEFNTHFHNCPDDCDRCVVYKTLAKRCYKLMNLPDKFGHLKLYCKTSCEECNYYKYVKSNN